MLRGRNILVSSLLTGFPGHGGEVGDGDGGGVMVIVVGFDVFHDGAGKSRRLGVDAFLAALLCISFLFLLFILFLTMVYVTVVVMCVWLSREAVIRGVTALGSGRSLGKMGSTALPSL